MKDSNYNLLIGFGCGLLLGLNGPRIINYVIEKNNSTDYIIQEKKQSLSNQTMMETVYDIDSYISQEKSRKQVYPSNKNYVDIKRHGE